MLLLLLLLRWGGLSSAELSYSCLTYRGHRPSEMFGTFQRLDQTLIIKLGFIKHAPLPPQGTTSQEFHFAGLLCNIFWPLMRNRVSVCGAALPSCADTRGSEVLTLCRQTPEATGLPQKK